MLESADSWQHQLCRVEFAPFPFAKFFAQFHALFMQSGADEQTEEEKELKFK